MVGILLSPTQIKRKPEAVRAQPKVTKARTIMSAGAFFVGSGIEARRGDFKVLNSNHT